MRTSQAQGMLTPELTRPGYTHSFGSHRRFQSPPISSVIFHKHTLNTDVPNNKCYRWLVFWFLIKSPIILNSFEIIQAPPWWSNSSLLGIILLGQMYVSYLYSTTTHCQSLKVILKRLHAFQIAYASFVQVTQWPDKESTVPGGIHLSSPTHSNFH